MTAGLATSLWVASEDLARAALDHPFVRGLATGLLPRERFAAYIEQDAYFLESFARAYALALAYSPDPEGIAAFARLIDGVLDELRLHAGYAARWGVELTSVRPGPATTAYTDFLLSTAAERDTGLICAALTPCMRLYAWLGAELARAPRPEPEPYSDWIATYAGEPFAGLAAELERLLDRYAEPSGAVRETYRRAMRLELGFFDAHAPVPAA